MRRLGIEFLGAFGLSPVKLVELAADLGCQFISTVIEPVDYNPENFPRWSLRGDAGLRADLKAVIADRGVVLELGEGFAILPDVDVRAAYAADLDLYRDLGVRRINSLSFDPDMARTHDQFAALAEMASERGLEPVLEFVPISPINNLAAALETVRHAGGNAKVLVDTMHHFRAGGTAAELAAAPAELVGHIQLCDVPATPTIADYLEEAMYERGIPGTGDAPLADYLAALSPSLSIGLEIPLRSLVEQGIGVAERKRRCVEAARAVIAQADAKVAA